MDRELMIVLAIAIFVIGLAVAMSMHTYDQYNECLARTKDKELCYSTYLGRRTHYIYYSGR